MRDYTMRWFLNKRLAVLVTIIIIVLGMSESIYADQGKKSKMVDASGVAMQDKSIIIIGASYSAGWDIAELGGLKIINKGAGGEQTFEILARFQKDVIDIKPDFVIIWGFINDIFRSERDKMPATIESAKTNIIHMVTLARENNVEPILATEVTIAKSEPDNFLDSMKTLIATLLGKESYQQYINKQVIDVNDWLLEYAMQNQIEVFDIHSVLSNEDGYRVKEYAADDGSHITKAAYDVLTEHAQKMIPGKLE